MNINCGKEKRGQATFYNYKEGDFPITEDVTGRTVALPFFNNLKEEQIDYVVEKLKEGIEISR